MFLSVKKQSSFFKKMRAVDFDPYDVDILTSHTGCDDEEAKETLKKFGNDLARCLIYLINERPPKK